MFFLPIADKESMVCLSFAKAYFLAFCESAPPNRLGIWHIRRSSVSLLPSIPQQCSMSLVGGRPLSINGILMEVAFKSLNFARWYIMAMLIPLLSGDSVMTYSYSSADSDRNILTTATYGTSRINAYKILEKTLKLKL